jgi:hypothetical protein
MITQKMNRSLIQPIVRVPSNETQSSPASLPSHNDSANGRRFSAAPAASSLRRACVYPDLASWCNLEMPKLSYSLTRHGRGTCSHHPGVANCVSNVGHEEEEIVHTYPRKPSSITFETTALTKPTTLPVMSDLTLTCCRAMFRSSTPDSALSRSPRWSRSSCPPG